MNNSVSFYTLGCRLNQAETAILQRSFEQNGFEVVDFKSQADVVVINTCTVTENGDADTRKIVNKINRLNPEARIALIGCQSQIQREELTVLPNVYWIIGNELKMDSVKIIKENPFPVKPQVITPVISRKKFTNPVAGIDRQHTRANLKIQDGCDFFCSFCVIPYARGRARSRDYKDILSEAKELVKAGHREVVLTGINIGKYQQTNKKVFDVIQALENLPGLDRIRISSIEPTTIPSELFDSMNNGKLCRYLHVPLQSGSDQILKSMNRRYSAQEFSDFIHFVYENVPNICLGTDVIVGFPGESQFHFEETYQFLLELPLTYFHVFSYSARPRTKSYKLKDHVSKEAIEKRSYKLRQLSTIKRKKYLEKYLGTEQNVLFEQKKKGFWTGLTDTYIRLKVDSEKDFYNQIIPVRLESIEGNIVWGSIVN